MKLSDIMGAAGLAAYAEIGLVIFMVVFVVVAIRVLWFGRREDFERQGRIPLEHEDAFRGTSESAEGEAS